MNLVMLDIDGTLTQSYDYDKEIFGLTIGEVLNCPPVDADLSGYVNKTSLGVTEEAIRRILGRNPKGEEIEAVKRKVLWHLERMFQEAPQVFGEVPGAASFLERLRSLDEAGIAIATGAWLSEALFKLRASGLEIDGIPIASSDDDRNRMRIMTLAAEKARQFYGSSGFEHIVYLGDGPWDLHASRSLGYAFIGMGSRVQTIRDTEAFLWHPDFLDLNAVFDSITKALNS